MSNRYWVGGTGTWNGTSTTNWSTATGLSFTASCTGTVLTTTGSPALVAGMTVWSSTFVSLGTVVSGSANTWVVSVGGTYASQGMSAATVGASVPTSADNVFFDANSNSSTTAFTVTMATVAAVCADLDATAVDGVMTLAGTVALDVYGSFSLPITSRFTRSYSSTTTFRSTTTGKTVSTNGNSLAAVTFDGVGGGWTLATALTTPSPLTLTNGSLNLGGFTASCFNFSSNNSNIRTLAFNGGSITIAGTSNTGNQTLWNVATATNLTVTGTPTVNVINNSTNSGFTRTFNNGNTAGGSEAVAVTLNIQAGDTGSLVTVGGFYLNLNFTGCSSTLNNNARTIYGNLTFSSTMVLTSGANAITFGSTSATVRTITTNAQTLDFPVTFNGVGGSWQLQDALTVGTSRLITLTAGTFDSNSKAITCGTFGYVSSNTKTLTLGTSTVTITGGTSTTGFVGSNSNTTYSVASSTIVFSNTGCFAGGQAGTLGAQFGTLTMSAAGGTLYLGTGATTVARCTTLNNTVQPCTITNALTTSFTVDNFNVSGTAGNLVTFNSNTAGTARTINKTSGTTNAYYLNIQDSTATGGTWNAYNSTNSGNNTGWNFLSGNFLVFF